MTTLERSYGVVPIAQGFGGWELLLVQQRDEKGAPTHWSFPKGHSEEGESPQETALRELEEETNLSLDSSVLLYPALEYDYSFLSKAGMVHKIASLYPVFLKQTLDISSDAPDIYRVRWMNIPTAKAMMKFDSAQSFLTQLEEWIHHNTISS